jgi:acid phosphatase
MGKGFVLSIVFSFIFLSCSKQNNVIKKDTSFVLAYQHVIIVILENHSYAQIINNTTAPFINSLISQKRTALFSDSHGITHPSQPNYINLFSGSSQGVTNNYPSLSVPFTTPNLGSELIKNGYHFSGYCEDLPSVGYTGYKSGSYVSVLNPWVNWQGTASNSIPAESNQPFSNFPSDFTKLPEVSIIIPNLKHNMHDGSIAASDSWLSLHLKSYTDWADSTNNLFILTFDEDDDSPDNHIPTLAISRNIKPGTYDQKINHFNLLRTIEANFNISFLGSSADSSSIKAILK